MQPVNIYKTTDAYGLQPGSQLGEQEGQGFNVGINGFQIPWFGCLTHPFISV